MKAHSLTISMVLALVTLTSAGCGDSGGSPGSGGNGASSSSSGGSGGNGASSSSGGGSTSSNGGGDPGDPSSNTGGSGPSSSSSGGGVPYAKEVCTSFCAVQTSCSQFPLQDCQSQCEFTIDIFADVPASCQDAVRAGIECMAGQTCETYDDASLPSGACMDELQAQLDVCPGAGYFPGWEACVASCRHAVSDCHVDVPSVSTYMNENQCWGECKLNSLENWQVDGCLREALDYTACTNSMPCDQLQAHLDEVLGEAPPGSGPSQCNDQGDALAACLRRAH